MKNIIIAAYSSYFFYGFCVVRHWAIPIMAFFLFWLIIAETEELINDYKRSVKRGQRLNRKINRARRSVWTENNSQYLRAR